MGICKVKLSSNVRHLETGKREWVYTLGSAPHWVRRGRTGASFSLKTGFTRRPPSPGQEKSLLLYKSCPNCENLDVPWSEMLWWRSASSPFAQLLHHCPLMLAGRVPCSQHWSSCCRRVLGPAGRWEMLPKLHVLTLTTAQIVSLFLIKICWGVLCLLDILFSFYKSVV